MPRRVHPVSGAGGLVPHGAAGTCVAFKTAMQQETWMLLSAIVPFGVTTTWAWCDARQERLTHELAVLFTLMIAATWALGMWLWVHTSGGFLGGVFELMFTGALTLLAWAVLALRFLWVGVRRMSKP